MRWTRRKTGVTKELKLKNLIENKNIFICSVDDRSFPHQSFRFDAKTTSKLSCIWSYVARSFFVTLCVLCQPVWEFSRPVMPNPILKENKRLCTNFSHSEKFSTMRNKMIQWNFRMSYWITLVVSTWIMHAIEKKKIC